MSHKYDRYTMIGDVLPYHYESGQFIMTKREYEDHLALLREIEKRTDSGDWRSWESPGSHTERDPRRWEAYVALLRGGLVAVPKTSVSFGPIVSVNQNPHITERGRVYLHQRRG